MWVIYLASALAAGGLLFLLCQPEGRQKILFLKPYTYLYEIQQSRPDLILVGNSWLVMNVDHEELEMLLTQMEGRLVHVYFAAESQRPNAWFYLVLKNQISPSRQYDIPVGLFFADDNLTAYNRHLDKVMIWNMTKLMTDDETVMLRKTGYRYPQAGSLAQYRPDRIALSQFLLNEWVNRLSAWIPGQLDAKRSLESRFLVKNTQPFEMFMMLPPTGEYDRDSTHDPACLDIPACLDKTLLPDMIQVMRGFQFFVVDVARNPNSGPPFGTTQYRRDLLTYLSQQRVGYLSLLGSPELAQSSLFLDAYHLTAEGRRINTQLVARMIHERRLLRSIRTSY